MKGKMNLEDVEDEGLIFVRNNTLVGLTTCVITDQPYDTVGLYFTDTITGVKKVHYLLIDVITGMRKSSVDDYGSELDDIKESDTISRISVSRLKDIFLEDGETIDVEATARRRAEFRIHTTNIANADTRGWADYVRRLFGKRLTVSGNRYNSIDMINVIVKLILGELTPVWTSNPPGIDARVATTVSDVVTAQSMALFQGEVSDADVYNVPIQSYLVENDLFETPVDINRDITDDELRTAFNLQMLEDTAFGTVLEHFQSFLRTDTEFQAAVISGVQVRLDRKNLMIDQTIRALTDSTSYLTAYLTTLIPGSPEYIAVEQQILANYIVLGYTFA